MVLNHTADGESHLPEPNSMLFHGIKAFPRTERWLQRMGEIHRKPKNQEEYLVIGDCHFKAP